MCVCVCVCVCACTCVCYSETLFLPIHTHWWLLQGLVQWLITSTRAHVCCYAPYPQVLPLPSSPLCSVPASAPNFTIDATTATSITVAWQPLPGCDQNGVITNYTIAYTIVGNTTFTNTVVGAADRSAVISPLTPFTNYTIKMAASTSVGRGSFGDEVTVQTNEAGTVRLCGCVELCGVNLYYGRN